MKTGIHHILQQWFLAIIVMAASFFCSCSQKELVFDFQPLTVSVDFDWIHAEDADPKGMTVLFFPSDGTSKAWRFDIEGREGGDIEIFPGDYRILAYNNDLPGVDFINKDSFDRYAATVRMVSDSLAASTGMLYGARLQEVHIGNGHGFTRRVKLIPDSLSTIYHVSLDSVSGSERIKTATAILKGIAKSVCMQNQRKSSESCSISAPFSILQEKRSILEATASGFGTPEIAEPRITLEVIVTTSHGKYSKSVDVTYQVMNSTNPKNVFINITGLQIPEADPSNPDNGPGVGISVGVDGWQVIEINYS